MGKLAVAQQGCVFCAKFAKEYRAIDEVAVFEPLNPVTPGHLLVVPVQHVTDFMADPEVSARTMEHAAQAAKRLSYKVFAEALHEKGGARENDFGMNLITSAAEPATQSVFHLHIHLVPRRTGDGLHLPWTGQNEPRD